MERQYHIAVASRRYDKVWRNRALTWEELCGRLADPVVTAETMAEYRVMRRDRQTDVKDVGGFVGGYLEEGSRRNGKVRFRSVVTLDYDSFDAGHLGQLRVALEGTAWALHSTHKHTAEAWRVRLVVPAGRDLTPDEYGAVARRVAEKCGMEGIDRSTFEPARLMFWPSRSKDAPYLYERGEGGPLDVDAVLGSYVDWRDVSSWPLLPCEEGVAKLAGEGATAKDTQQVLEEMSRALGGGRKIEDPLEKKGVVGAFCRTYDVASAIELYLGHVYNRERGHRWTHIGSSTHGGGVTLDGGRFFYSFHSTDPVAGRCLNSFDLVRLHLFGHLDHGVASDTRATRLPSFEAMRDLALEDGGVKRRLMEERAEEARSDYGETQTEEGQEEEERDAAREKWDEVCAGLEFNKNGSLKTTIANVAAVVAYSPELGGRMRYNAFARRVEVFGSLPWNRENAGRFWTNNDDACLREYLERAYDLSGKEKIFDGFTVGTNELAYHPVKDYFASLQWDGVKRLERVYPDVMGAEDTALNRELFRLMLVGCVARIYRPGTKFDYFIILYGPEGCGKSTLLSVMGGEWFSDSVTTFDGKQGMEEIQGAMLIESGELTSYKRSDSNAIKGFISRQVDSFRPAYGRTKEILPRQCVMVGTTNEALFLRGIDTGNRRNPVVEIRPELRKVEESVRDWVTAHRDQLWAEAIEEWRGGYRLWLDETLEQEARKTQEAHNYDIQNPIFGEVERFLDLWLPDYWDESYDTVAKRLAYLQDEGNWQKGESWENCRQRMTVTMPEILQEGLRIERTSKDYRTLGREIGQYLNRLGNWEGISSVRTRLYGRQRGWRRKNYNLSQLTLNDL